MSHKRPKNKKKEQKKIAQKARALLKKKEAYNEIFNLLDIKEKINFLPINFKNKLFNFSYPQPQILINEIKNLSYAQNLQDQIRDMLADQYVKIYDKKLPLNNFHYFVALEDLIRNWYLEAQHFIQQDKDIKNKELASKIIDSLNYINSKISPIFKDAYCEYVNKICDVVAKTSLIFYEFENGIYPQLKIEKNEARKPYPVIVLKKLNIKKINLTLENKSRAAYPLMTFSFAGLEPCVFEPNVIDNEQVVPIYVQDHALKRLQERIKIAPLGYIHDCLGKSLSNPVVVGMDGSSYLIEFKLYSYRVGYLLVSKSSNFALVRSFKFLTMTGTPEFNELSKHLRATKYDFSYLGLDDLETFANSDVSKDPQLREIFIKCGLEDLLRISEIKNIFQSPKIAVAQEIKDYFNF
jgi:hypothetical protein